MNMSNALSDVGDGARALEAALTGIETLYSIEDGDAAVKAEIAAAHQNIVGKLIRDGDCEAAIETARAGVTVFRELLDEGRTDLAGEYGRLLGAYGFALERTQDIAGAIAATTASLDAYATAPGVPRETRELIREGLEPRLEGLLALERSGPGELGALLDETRGTVESATSMSREGMTAEASMLLEEAVGRLTFLLGRFPSDVIRRDLGHAASILGMVAFAAARPRVAQRALGLAIDSFGFLVEQSGERDRVDDLGRSYGALASLLAYDGDSEGVTEADMVIDEMYERLRRFDRRKARDWRTKTREIVRAARGGG
jgi:hypothetical protein